MVVPHTIDEQKCALRVRMRAARLQKPIEPLAEAMLRDALFRVVMNTSAQVVGCVWPLPGEADLRPICRTLHEAGRTVLLPETTPPGLPLSFRVWTPGATMVPGRFGTMHPDAHPGEGERVPELLLVPLLAFDSEMRRLGYGGGYYDRTLEAFGCEGIGFAFSWQEVDFVPVGPHDRTLGMIVTEHGPVQDRQREHSAQ